MLDTMLVPAPYRRWIAASLRECMRPLVLAYLVVVAGTGAARAYSHWPGIDVPMHYVGALVLTHVIHRGVGHAMRFGILPRLRPGPRALGEFSLVCTASLLWEIAEFLSDRYLGTRTQGGLADTLSDMLTDVLGSASYLIFRLSSSGSAKGR
jgi:hypothetical protein